MGEMILPVVTTATGAFLVVLVFGMSDGIRAQSASLGHAEEIGRAVVLIAVTVLLVGVVEVAVATTRTVAHRTRELGVLGANGVPRVPVVAALLVEPVISAVLGAVAGAGLAVGIAMLLGATGFVPTGVSVGGLILGAAIAVVVSIVAALATSIVPTWTAASRPPIRSLSTGG
jgi:ABC-type antimicrobial peptide transport system permease subunit